MGHGKSYRTTSRFQGVQLTTRLGAGTSRDWRFVRTRESGKSPSIRQDSIAHSQVCQEGRGGNRRTSVRIDERQKDQNCDAVIKPFNRVGNIKVGVIQTLPLLATCIRKSPEFRGIA